MAGPYNFNFSHMQHDQSQQTAPNIPSMGFEAATAALDTNELLHLIIAEVPREFRNSLRRVSKSWQAAVVKLGYVREPTYPAEDTGEWTIMPKYELEQTLVCNKSNPAIACYSDDAKFDCPDEDTCGCDGLDGYSVDICFDPHKIGKQEEVKRELEFITNPPITEVEVAVGDRRGRGSAYDDETAVLRVPGGIRVRDLKECFGKMRYFDHAYGSVASFGVLWHEPDRSRNGLPFFQPNLMPDPLDDYRRPRFESETGESQDETGDGDTPYTSEADDVSQGEEGNFSPKQYDQSPPGAEVQGYEAATAALDTNELLHLIIAEVPRQYRTKLSSVSKNWKAAVEKIGYTFDPLRPIEDRGSRTMLPKYGILNFGKRLVCNKTNPAIACYTEDDYFECPGCGADEGWCDTCEDVASIHARICFDPYNISKQGGVERELEFITDPPITLVTVSVGISCDWWTSKRDRQTSVLRVPGGIRVRDLKGCFEKMRPCDYAYSRVASFAVLGQMQHEFCESFPIAPKPNEVPTPVCWLHVDDCSTLGGAGVDGESREQSGGCDTPYASETDDSQGGDGEFCEGGSENEEAKSGYQSYQRRLEDELEKWSNSSQGDACGTGYAETRYANYAAGDYGKGALTSDKPKDRYEWSFENRLEGWSYGGQGLGDGIATGDHETPRAIKADYYVQGDYGEGSPASKEPEDGSEWNWEAEVKKWSKGSQGDASETGGGETPYVNTVDYPGQGIDGDAGFTREELEGGHEWNFEAELEKWSKLA
jgi:hypothetical protein